MLTFRTVLNRDPAFLTLAKAVTIGLGRTLKNASLTQKRWPDLGPDEAGGGPSVNNVALFVILRRGRIDPPQSAPSDTKSHSLSAIAQAFLYRSRRSRLMGYFFNPRPSRRFS